MAQNVFPPDPPDIDRRLARIQITPELVVGIATGLSGTLPDGRKIEVIENDMPEFGGRVHRTGYDSERDAFVVIFRHPSFEVVPVGASIPLLRGPTMTIAPAPEAAAKKASDV